MTRQHCLVPSRWSTPSPSRTQVFHDVISWKLLPFCTTLALHYGKNSKAALAQLSQVFAWRHETEICLTLHDSILFITSWICTWNLMSYSVSMTGQKSKLKKNRCFKAPSILPIAMCVSALCTACAVLKIWTFAWGCLTKCQEKGVIHFAHACSRRIPMSRWLTLGNQGLEAVLLSSPSGFSVPANKLMLLIC